MAGLDPTDLEQALRLHAEGLSGSRADGLTLLAVDGKSLRGSFDTLKDKKATQPPVSGKLPPSSLSDLAKKGPLGAIFDHRLRAKAYIMLRMARMTHESCTKSLSPTGCEQRVRFSHPVDRAWPAAGIRCQCQWNPGTRADPRDGNPRGAGIQPLPDAQGRHASRPPVACGLAAAGGHYGPGDLRCLQLCGGGCAVPADRTPVPEVPRAGVARQICTRTIQP